MRLKSSIALFICIALQFASYGQYLDYKGAPPDPGVQTENNPVIFYTEDFQNGLNTGWQVIDSAGYNELWQFTLTGPKGSGAGPYDILKSPTASNGFMMIDDDFYGNNNTTTVTALLSPAIDCSAKSKVRLSYSQYYKHYSGCSANVYVSNNLLNWQLVQQVHSGMQSLDATSNPAFSEIDITGVAANQPTVYLLFVYTGNWGYFWEIDDVALSVPDQTDAGLIAISGLASTCNSQASDTVSFIAKNFGYQSWSVLPVGYTINGGAVQTQNFSQLMSQLQQNNFTLSPALAFPSTDKYVVQVFTQLAGDQNPDNDTITNTIYVGPVDVQAHNFTTGFEPGEDLSNWVIEDTDSDGVTFDFPVSYAHTGVRCLRMPWFYLLDTIAENWIFSPCLHLQGGPYYNLSFYYHAANDTLKTYDIEIFLTNGQSSGNVLNSIGSIPAVNDTTYQLFNSYFNAPNTGTYYLGFKFTGINVKCARRIDDLAITYTTEVEDQYLANKMQLYPNPTQHFITIDVQEPAGDAQLTVTDIYGHKVIETRCNQNPCTINISELPKGVYAVHINTKNKNIISSFIVN